MLFAGGGMKRGFTYGETDDLGYLITKDEMTVRDLHATMLHLLGLERCFAENKINFTSWDEYYGLVSSSFAGRGGNTDAKQYHPSNSGDLQSILSELKNIAAVPIL